MMEGIEKKQEKKKWRREQSEEQGERRKEQKPASSIYHASVGSSTKTALYTCTPNFFNYGMLASIFSQRGLVGFPTQKGENRVFILVLLVF